MSLTNLHQGILAASAVTESFPEARVEKATEQGADAALTARAIVVVTFMGAGFWYGLWKIALYFVAGH